MSEIREPKYQCSKCHNFEAKYDFKDHKFVCGYCDYVQWMKWRLVRCPRCGNFYSEYTTFDPSGCSHCPKSFVE